ncbi:MAG: FAD-dependent oxidoreductase [Gammaproteobacteria bacterium]|nr:FAD-dependent oxidoreductase [Gammaproteobacteria bacterium]
MPEHIVIVGAGQAAAQAIDTLRRREFRGRITLIGDEAFLPYQRPPLSKKYLAGALARERLALRSESYYAERAVELRLGHRCVRIDRDTHRIGLDDGEVIAYDALLLATGSRPRALQVPGAQLPGVFYLRTLADVDAIHARLREVRRVAVIGGGYIGLEVAATCRELGHDAVVLEMADRVMNRVVCPRVSRFFEAEHARHGVRIVLDARVAAVVGAQRAEGVALADGSIHPADLVVVGVGAEAADGLARQSGLECTDGICVDEHCRTSDRLIHAAGDCTNHPSRHYGRRVRLESVDGAFEQGTVAALDMLGEPAIYDKVPWFWSDQYDLKLVIVGLALDHEQIVLRGDPATRAFSACYLRAGELVAIETVNRAKDQIAARKLIAGRARFDPTKLSDPDILLKDCTLTGIMSQAPAFPG